MSGVNAATFTTRAPSDPVRWQSALFRTKILVRGRGTPAGYATVDVDACSVQISFPVVDEANNQLLASAKAKHLNWRWRRTSSARIIL